MKSFPETSVAKSEEWNGGKIGDCPICGMIGIVERRPRNTRYEDPESNVIECCELCYEMDNDYNTERWLEYYGMNYGNQL